MTTKTDHLRDHIWENLEVDFSEELKDTYKRSAIYDAVEDFLASLDDENLDAAAELIKLAEDTRTSKEQDLNQLRGLNLNNFYLF